MAIDNGEDDTREVKRLKTISNERDTENQIIQSQQDSTTQIENLYLETVDRSRLDFDFEKVCTVSLSNINIYACLTCGKYYQGRGKSSHAYFHSVNEDHHVFVNLSTTKIYVLPEGYEVKSHALNDIKYQVAPSYTKKEVLKLNKNTEVAFDLQHKPYKPGFIGMNNIKQNDYANVIIQALSHVSPLRNYFLLEDFSKKQYSSSLQYAELLKRFSILISKIWSSKAFKSHISPHELLQFITILSKKRFTPTKQSDPFSFLTWLLNQLHLASGGSKIKPQSSIIHNIFQGKLKTFTQKIIRNKPVDEVVEKIIPFMCLSLDLPDLPLFKSENGIIPQVTFNSLLTKYNGLKTHEGATSITKYKIVTLPPLLTIHIKRFDQSSLIDEINPTVVTFPTTETFEKLDMSPYVENGENTGPIYYRLIANITHELRDTSLSKAELKKKIENGENQPGGTGSADYKKVIIDDTISSHIWSIYLLDKSDKSWCRIQDLIVENVQKELMFLRESYIQIWEKIKT